MTRITKIEKAFLIGIISIVVLCVGTSFVDEEFFLNSIVMEDGPIEWLSVVGLLACAALAMVRLVKGKQTDRNVTYLLGLLFATAVFLFGAGEEISWGQRIFNIESPEFFLQRNVQKETNLHNLVIGETKINKLVFGKILAVGILTYLFLLPWLWALSSKIQILAARWAVPVPTWKQSLLYIGLFVVCSLVASSKRGELIEFAGIWMFFVILLNPTNVSIYREGKPSEEIKTVPLVPKQAA